MFLLLLDKRHCIWLLKTVLWWRLSNQYTLKCLFFYFIKIMSPDRYEMCELLIKSGANINNIDNTGNSILSTASQNGNLNIFWLCISRKERCFFLLFCFDLFYLCWQKICVMSWIKNIWSHKFCEFRFSQITRIITGTRS